MTAIGGAGSSTYVVRSGDTLADIASRHDVALADVLSANDHIADPATIHPGDQLYIPRSPQRASQGQSAQVSPESPAPLMPPSRAVFVYYTLPEHAIEGLPQAQQEAYQFYQALQDHPQLVRALKQKTQVGNPRGTPNHSEYVGPQSAAALAELAAAQDISLDLSARAAYRTIGVGGRPSASGVARYLARQLLGRDGEQIQVDAHGPPVQFEPPPLRRGGANAAPNAPLTRQAEAVLNSRSVEVTRHDELIAQAADAYNLPRALVKAVVAQESNFQANATSWAGAKGLMQLMDGTAEMVGVWDSYDPQQNVVGGARYLRYLTNKYDGNLELILAGYNAGPGNVERYNGIPPFRETRNYVRNVQVLYAYYQQQGVPAVDAPSS